MSSSLSRRDLLQKTPVLLAGLTVAASAFADEKQEKKDEPEVTATEDLMREHGVIRRALLIYAELVPKLRTDPGSVDPAALHKTAELFRTFGEDYHERQLEEQHIFPVVRKMNKAKLTDYADVLTAQHQRGREITEYVLAVTNGKIGKQHADELIKIFEAFPLMYQNHAAREDTIVFPAWKTNFTNKQLDEIGDQFEAIEHKTFGKDGFDDAEETISKIEATFGFTDIAQFTPPAPPKP
ncbi:MAG TPA: hemerythrin domain-containing protein [Candidatus Koribacter sp.]|jgi:hemerythrin-like domain-containing protein